MASDDNGPSAGGRGKQDILDGSLRDRVNRAIAELKQRYDAAVAQPTEANLDELRDAMDRLMRAGARVLIEIERHGDNTNTDGDQGARA